MNRKISFVLALLMLVSAVSWRFFRRHGEG